MVSMLCRPAIEAPAHLAVLLQHAHVRLDAPGFDMRSATKFSHGEEHPISVRSML